MDDLDFLSTVLLDGQEFEFEFNELKGDFIVEGKIKIKEQAIIAYPKKGTVLCQKTVAWIRTHPHHWRILCGLEQADAKMHIRVMGMLIRANLNELAEMMSYRIRTMI